MGDIVYIVNVEGAIVRAGQYLMIVRGQAETHASGALSFVGGKVEATDEAEDVLEEAVRREIMEEVGVRVGEMRYVQSNQFTTADGRPVVNIIFLCQFDQGEPRITNIDEVAQILWLSAPEVASHPACPPWLTADIVQVEAMRQRIGW